MYLANQLWFFAEEDLKDMFTNGALPERTMVLCESAEKVDKWARKVPDSAGFMDDYEPQYQPYMQQIYDCIVEKHSIPETYAIGQKEHKLQTLFCMNILCGGVEITKASDMWNVVTFLPEDLHALSFLRCCSYNVNNFVVVYSPEVCHRGDVHPYLQRENFRFFRSLKIEGFDEVRNTRFAKSSKIIPKGTKRSMRASPKVAWYECGRLEDRAHSIGCEY